MPRTIPTISEFFNPSFGDVMVVVVVGLVVVVVIFGVRSKK